MEEIKKYIQEMYKAEDGARTPLWSLGNCNDVFQDGEQRGVAKTLSDIAEIIGLEIKPLEKQVYDN